MDHASTPSRAMTVFGIAVIVSGLWRYLGQEGGEKGLWFGLVMGGVALSAAMALAPARQRNARRPGMALSIASLALVGGWFAYEALIKKGVAEAEPRQLLVLGLAVATSGVLAVHFRSRTSGDRAAA